MPWLDVSDVLLDPMLAQTLTVIRRAQTVTSGGIETETRTILNPIGVVTVTGSPYALEPDLQRDQDTITVHTNIPLRGPASGFAPDIIVWRGNNYTVNKSLDWSQYGNGFYAAECVMLDPQTAVI